MPRTVKNPEERKRELLVTAMRLFADEGYDNVSVRAVARAAGVAPGLAYHYFDSKQNMFDAAIEEYSRRCSEGIIAILDDRSLSLDEKLDRAFISSAFSLSMSLSFVEQCSILIVKKSPNRNWGGSLIRFLARPELGDEGGEVALDDFYSILVRHIRA